MHRQRGEFEPGRPMSIPGSSISKHLEPVIVTLPAFGQMGNDQTDKQATQ